MEILPAIDLLAGRCVRLMQGRYDRIIEYEGDPLEVALRFRAAGATWLHVIDLDGARNGRLENLAVLRRLAARTGAHIEFGGGVRDEAAIDAALDAGAERVIVGTRALEDWPWFERIVHDPRYRQHVALGLDARVSRLAVRGWTCQTQHSPIDVVKAAAGWPLASIVYTDIGRDGLLLGPNLTAIEHVAAAATVPVIASGGISDLEDVRHLAAARLAGVVIGRAIYEGAIDLKDALAATRPA